MPVKLSSLIPKSISLFAQLVLTFVALVAATATGLTVFSYRASLDNLQAAAQRNADMVAETRVQMLAQLLAFRRERADGFLATAESVCGEPAGSRVGWSEPCVRTMLREFRLTEGAEGATLTYRGRRLSAVGESVSTSLPDDRTWSVVIQESGRVAYVMSAQRGGARLALEFDESGVLPFFSAVAGLQGSGEVFLIDREGRPLTPLGYAATRVTLGESAERCRRGGGTSDSEEVDYRRVRVFRAFRLVPEIPGACVVAHVPYAEALAPAARLRRDLALSSASFVLVGILLSLIAARHIAAPVRRLAGVAGALRAGDFTRPVPVVGPSEVRDLGRAFAAMSNDLAELVSQEQAARREAEAANRSKDQFLAMLAHELRTPLTAMLGWTHTLRTMPRDDPERIDRAALAIERSAQAQHRLIEDLLDISGIAAGRIRIVPAPTTLARIVDEALDVVAPRADDKKVRLERLVENPESMVYGDAQRLQQIVWNLAWNAVKFTPAGGTVRVRTRAVGGLAELTVSDTGVGIEPEFLPHVFGWFRRADREVRGVDEGLGLGLALVRQLVELHGGSVRAESGGHDCGSTFVVTLPLFHEGSAAAPSTGDAQRTDVAHRLASIRVLVVDDDAGSREAVRVLLEQVGARVETAASAAEARRHLRSTETDVLISDIAMAQESGYTLMQALRAEGLTLPGIALTAYARREDADKAYAAGFDVHLPKPVDPDVLVSVLVAVTRREDPE